MNEIMKTLCFAGAAVLIVAVAWLNMPGAPVADNQDLKGQRLFPNFNNELAATSMEIVEFDQDTAEVRPFTVAQVDLKGEGKPRWSIPTHENYPADARDQVANAAAGLMGLKILDVVGNSPRDHEEYGVVDPDPNKRKGTTGVGRRVTMKDNRGKVLMSLVIGKEVPDRSGLHYVRKVDEDPVYIVKVSTDKLSSKFEDWIEEDLLKLSTWDIKQIRIRDHSVDELNSRLIQRGEMTLDYDDTGDVKWKLVKDEAFQNNQWVPRELAEDEELDTDKLDGLKSALDDLEIVDVRRKPSGLSGDLKAAADFANNAQARQSLAERGFFFAQVGDRVELYSNEGEIRCLMKDGVEYVLRFGEISGAGTAAPEKEKKEGQDEDEGEGSGSAGLNRFIFVMAEFNGDIIPKPELQPLPEEKPKPAADEAPKGEKPEESKDGQESPQEDPKDGSAEEKAGQESKPANAGEEPAETKEENADHAKDDAKADDAKADDAKGDDVKADDAKDDAKAEAKADHKEDLEAKRKEVRKENQRKQEEYDEKIEKGKKKVKELNDRFADWYYVISDKVYQKIHLGRDQIVKKKEKKEEEDVKKNGQETDTGPANNDSSDAAAEKPEEPTGPVGEFEKLKQEGPGKGE